MLDVEQIPVNIHIPSEEVRIVAMQPFIQLHSETEEPFRWSDSAVGAQLSAIRRTLDIAQDGFAGQAANFTIFPEYAIPGKEGAAIIDERMAASAWPNESVIIAGIHGIPQSEYKVLCDMLGAHYNKSNSPDSVPYDQWVNCGVIWIKDRDGVVQRWVQPKVRRAWEEMKVTCSDMFCGSIVYVFGCQYEPSQFLCNFATVICFDWVAKVAGSTVCDQLLAKLNEIWAVNPKPLHWIFVIQHNPSPNHQLFLNSTYRFLIDPNTYPFVLRDKAVVLHANTAISPRPAHRGKGGFSSCVFSPNAFLKSEGCRPTVCMKPSVLRGSDILERCIDVVFREMGECIHAFTIRVPHFVIPDASDRAYPLPLANVHATCDNADPRLRGGPVPAAVKWVNDSLDDVERLSVTAFEGCHLKAKAEAMEPNIIAGMRVSDGRAAANCVNWAACSFSRGSISRDPNRCNCADLWEACEAGALEHVLHSLTSIGLAYRLAFESNVLHSAVQGNEGFVQVIAIRGDTYGDCRLHYDRFIASHITDPVLVIARDRDNLTPTPEEFLKFDETENESGLAFIDFHTLVDHCRKAADSDSLTEILDVILPRSCRII